MPGGNMASVVRDGRAACVGRGVAGAAALAALLVASGVGGHAQGPPRAGQATPLMIESMVGRDLFGFYCASCHGRDGQGHGPVAPSLKTPPSDLTRIAARAGGQFRSKQVRDIVSGIAAQSTPAHGSGDMPVWGPIFRFLDPSDARVSFRIDQLVTYLESIQVK